MPDGEEVQAQHNTFNFFNSLFKSGSKHFVYKLKKIQLPFLIVALSRVALYWEFLFCGITLSTFVLISYAAFFAYYEETLWEIVFYADVVFSIDVMIRLAVELWRQQTQKKLVIFTTPYTMVQFILDSVAMIPSHQVYIWIVGTKTLHQLSLIDFCRFNRFLRLIRTYEFFEFLKEEKRANEKMVFIFSFTILYLGFIHVVSCALFWFVNVSPLMFLLHQDKHLLDDAWIADFQKKKLHYGDEPVDLYIISTHFSVALVTTVGYGDLFAANEKEMCLCIIVMLVGAILLSGYFTSQLTNFELETDGARFDLFFRLSGIKKLLVEVETLPFYNKRVEEYYKYLWTYREGVDKVAFQSQLPMAFQEDLQYDICQEMFDKSFLMHGLDEAFLRAVSKIVHVALYNPEMLLCRYGSYANKMFYILQGECIAVSKYDMNKPAGILRAGFLIGEGNLFFSYPYTTSVETRTCCQFLILEKEELMKLFDQFEDELSILRSRAQQKSRDMYKYYRKAGEDAISWVEAKDDLEEIDNENPLDQFLVMRWGDGLCSLVTEDVIDDTQEAVIFERLCSDNGVQKNHLTPYMTCVVPEIMVSEMEFVKYWNTLIMMCALVYAFVGPYCLSFGESTELEKTLCIHEQWFEVPNALLFLADIFVEIIAACPVYGFYYKFRDGLRLKKTEPMFYFDLLAGIPFEILYTKKNTNSQDPVHEINAFCKSMKLWKVVRYLHYLDNENPIKLFWFRLGQTCLILLYGIHFIACIFFTAACPTGDSGIECRKNTWLGSYAISNVVNNEPIALENTVEYLATDRPYLMAFFFSSATLTSVGFGNFSPQNKTEMIWACIFQLIGFFLIGYYTSVLTSALSCGVRPELAFQQKLVSIQQFMRHHHLKESLQDRIVEHYYLQHQFRGGINIPHGFVHFMYDAPDFLKKDVLYMEVHKLLEGIPIFTKCDAEAIIAMSAKMQRFLVPPNITFIHRGEVRRIMYLIKYGSIGIIDDETNQAIQILESSAHFGIRDMLFGEPCHFTIKTLSHCCLYSITHDQMRDVFAADEELIELIDAEKEVLSKNIEEMTHLYAIFATHRHQKKDEKPYKIPSWVCVSNEKQDMTYQEFENTLRDFPISRFFKFFLMHRVVHPVGSFASFWSCLISVVGCLTIMSLILETYMYIRNPYFRLFQISLDLLCYADIYLKMHWAYYIPGGWILVTSPIMTFLCYIMQGSFFMDVIVCTPFELFTFITGETSFLGYGPACSWYSTLRWGRFFQLTRIANIFKIAHTIFEARNLILLVVYVSVTLLVCTIVAAYAAYLGCPWSIADYTEGEEYKLPICLDGTWATTKIGTGVTASLGARWIAGLYYVSQVVLVIGFGDMITLSTSEILLLIFMSVFGFIFMRCVIADITAAEVDNDEIRAKFIEQLTVLKLVMTRENLDKKLMMSVMDYLNHTWERAKGLSPQVLFADLHPALESDVFRGLIRDRLFSVPIFSDFQHNIARALCQYMHQLYFVKGQRIMRCDNMEYEMIVIVEGRVWITDKDLNFVCSLTYGESFGESSLLYGTRREFNAIAACNVVVFVLTSNNFLLIKQRYPAVQDLFESKIKMPTKKVKFATKSHEPRSKAPSDLFVKKVLLRKDMISASSEPARIREAEFVKKETALIFDAVATRENLISEHHENLMIHERIIATVVGYIYGCGNHDENLPFLYFARNRVGRCNFVIHPNCQFMNWFLSIVYLLCYFTPAIAVYEVCFSIDYHKDSNDFITNLIKKVPLYIESILIAYIFIMFFTAVQTERGYYVKDNKKIALAYLISLTGFWLDCVGSIPYIIWFILDLLHVFDEGIVTNFYASKIGNYFSLLKTVRLYRFYHHHLSKKDDLSISTFRYKMTLSISSFCLMVHVLACVFYANSPCSQVYDENGYVVLQNPCKNQDSDEPTWTLIFSDTAFGGGLLWENDDQMKQWRWWVRSAYWVVTVISTTGFGDITAQKISEMVIAIVCIFCGAFVLSIILSHFTSGMASITKFHREYLYQVKLLVKHLRNIGLSQYRQDQVMAYFLMVWDRSRGIPYHKATQNLPITMQIEVCYSLYINVLKEVKMFRCEDNYVYHSLLRQISLRLVHSYYIPGVCIVKESEKGSSLFIVYKGQVSGTTQSQGLECPDLKKVYRVGHVFGRFPALFRTANLEETYKKSYRAEEPTEILELSQVDILHLTDHFPAFFDNLVSLIRHRYSNDDAGDSQPIFVKTTKKRGGIFDLTGFDSITKQKGKKPPHISNFPPEKTQDRPTRLSTKDTPNQSNKANQGKKSN